MCPNLGFISCGSFFSSEKICESIVRERGDTFWRTRREEGLGSHTSLAAMFRNAVRRVAAPVALRAAAVPARVVVPRAAASGARKGDRRAEF